MSMIQVTNLPSTFQTSIVIVVLAVTSIPGGTYTIYSDVGATNNIGSIVVDSSGGVQELTHTTGEIYSLVTGTIAFVGNNTNANVYVLVQTQEPSGLFLLPIKFLAVLLQSSVFVTMLTVQNCRLVRQQLLPHQRLTSDLLVKHLSMTFR